VSEYEASRRAKCGPVIALSGCADFPRSFFASDRLDLGRLWRHFKAALDVFGESKPDALPGATL